MWEVYSYDMSVVNMCVTAGESSGGVGGGRFGPHNETPQSRPPSRSQMVAASLK
jgi:hypothetical protein